MLNIAAYRDVKICTVRRAFRFISLVFWHDLIRIKSPAECECRNMPSLVTWRFHCRKILWCDVGEFSMPDYDCKLSHGTGLACEQIRVSNDLMLTTHTHTHTHNPAQIEIARQLEWSIEDIFEAHHLSQASEHFAHKHGHVTSRSMNWG